MSGRCSHFAAELEAAVSRRLVEGGCDCVLFSGGIDTSFIAMSAVRAGRRPRLVTVRLPGAADAGRTERAAEELGLELSFADASEERIGGCLRAALEVTRSIDPIEVAADVAVCLGLRAAKELGCRCTATGDGGDELFLGYPFLFDYDEEGIAKWYSRVLTGSRFASRDIGHLLGERVELPLYTDDARSIALRTPLWCKVNERNGRKYGKYLMRERLEEAGLADVAWAEKVPVTDGSGAMSLIASWSSSISPEEAGALGAEHGVSFPSRAHAYLFSAMRRMGLDRPGVCSDEGSRCPTCGSCLEGGFCRFCGTYVGAGGAVSHYSDYVKNK